MTSGQWHVLSTWHNAWLSADTAGRERLREQLSRDAPDLIDAADRLTADTSALDGFLETPAFFLEANALAARYAAEAGTTPGPVRTWRRTSRVSALIGLLLVAGIAGWLLKPVQTPPAGGEMPLVRFALALPAGLDLLSAPVLSPDGQRMAFVVGTGGSSRLMVRDLGDEGALVVGGTDGATFPFWSADGGWIGFSARGRLMKVASTGGAPVVIDGAVGNWGGAWSASGVVVFQPAVRNAGLQQVPANGGRAVPASRLDDAAGDFAHRLPIVLPDGRRFLYCLDSSADTRSGLYLGSLDTPTAAAATRLGDCSAIYVAVSADTGYLLSSTGRHIEARHVDLQRSRVGDPHALDILAACAPDGSARFSATRDVLAYAMSETDPSSPRHIGLVIGWRRLLQSGPGSLTASAAALPARMPAAAFPWTRAPARGPIAWTAKRPMPHS
jgi:hypothetical protein